jgi:hypothetical protein
MYTDYDIYLAFRTTQSQHNDKHLRLPKDWDSYKLKSLSASTRKCIDDATGYFNTKWSGIDLMLYMQCGFELYKSFGYQRFFDQPVLELYIQKDKKRKRRIKVNHESITESLRYIRSVVGDKDINGYTYLQMYCKMREGARKCLVHDHIHNRIDPLLFVYCLYYKYIKLTDDDKQLCYNITNRYRELTYMMFEVEGFIKEKERI